MYTEFLTAFNSLKAIKDLVTAIQQAKVDSAVVQKAIELQGAILSLQDAMMRIQLQNQELLEANNRFKQQLAEAENWEKESKKYQLVHIEDGICAYMMKPDRNRNDDPDYWLCTNCFQKKQKSILQRTGKEREGHIYICANCNARILTFNIPSPMNFEGD
jgi:hypothetical protein